MDIFSLVCHFSFLSPSLWQTAWYRLKYSLKGPLSPKQPTNSVFGSTSSYAKQTKAGQSIGPMLVHCIVLTSNVGHFGCPNKFQRLLRTTQAIVNSFKVVICGNYISYLHEIEQTSYVCFILYSLQCKIEGHAV